MIEVELPDGSIAEFPEGMSSEQIQGVLRKQFAAPPPQTRQGTAYTRFVESNPATRGLVGLGAGLVKAGTGAIQAGAQVVGADNVAQAAGRVTRKINQDVSRLGASGKVGEFVGEVGPYVALPSSAPTLAGRMILGAVGGGSQGLLQAQETPDGGQRVGDAVTQAAIGAVAPAALEGVAKGVGSAARNIMSPKPVNVAKNVVGDVADGISDVNVASDIQQTLAKRYAASERLEGAVWDKVRNEAANSKIGAGRTKELQNVLIKAQDDLSSNEAAGVVDRQLARLNRFIDSGQDIPASELIGIRRTLSKASKNEGGLRSAVDAVDKFIEKNAKVPSLQKALTVSRNQFQKFADAKVVAKAVEDGATGAEFSQAMFKSGSPATARGAARAYDEVLAAVGQSRKAEVQKKLEQATVHRLFEISRNQGKDSEFWIGKLAEQIGATRNKNPELWAKMSKETREGLKSLEQSLRKQGEAGALNKAGEFVLGLVGRSTGLVGLKTNLRLPSPIAPKTTAELDDILKLLTVKP